MSKKYPNMNDPQLEEPKRKRRTLNPFENLYRKDGKGVDRDEIPVLDKPGFANFFKLLRRKLNHIFSCNLLLIFGNFPVFFALAALAYTTNDMVAPTNPMYSVLMGSAYFDQSPVITTLLGVFGKHTSVASYTTATYVLLGLALLVLFTFGLTNVGTTYIQRNLLRGEPVFVWSDFWYAVRRNLKQGIIFGIIDLLVGAFLVYDLFSYRVNAGNSGLFMALYAATYCMIIMYFFIRMYAYPMIVTFDMGLFKIIKNSIYFSVLGIKRNIPALLSTVLLVIANVYIFVLFMPIGIVLPFIIMFGLLQFISVYCAFPKIKEIMIDPYYKEVAKTAEEQ